MQHELFLTTRLTTKTINIFANNISTNIKLIKTQISKIIQPGGSFGSWLDNLEKKALTNIAIPLFSNVNDNDNVNGINNIFIIKDTKLHVPVVTLSA